MAPKTVMDSSSAKTLSSEASGFAPQDAVKDVSNLVVGYLKQEAGGAAKGLGRYVAFGLIGAMSFAFGVVILMIGILRALQTQTGDTLDHNWSFAPYVALLALLGGAMFLTYKKMTKSKDV